jgi:hypothetical protein
MLIIVLLPAPFAERHVLGGLHAAIRLADALHDQQFSFAGGANACQRWRIRRPRSQLLGPPEPLRQQTHDTARHHVQREQQQEAVEEVLCGRPAGQQCVDQRQEHGTDERSIHRTRTAEEHEQQDEDRKMKGDEVRVDVLVLLRDQRTGDAAGHGSDDEGHHLGAVDAYADGRRGDLVGLQRQQCSTEAPEQQVAQQQVRGGADGHTEPDPLHGGEGLAVPGQWLDAVDALRAAEHLGPLADQLLDDDAKRQGHHRQVRALDSKRRQGDQDTTGS